MARRSVEWSKGLAQDLKDIRFAQEFIQASMLEGLSLQTILGKVVRAYGVREFSSKTKIPSANILRAVNPKHNPTIGTLNRLLKPFGLELTLGVASKKRVA